MLKPAAAIDFAVHPLQNTVSPSERLSLTANPVFGTVFTDHMATIRYSPEKGWHDPAVEARRPLELDPASSVLHYGQAIFEGLKAYRRDDGAISLFRADENGERFAASATRMAMPPLPPQLFVESLRRLVSIDRDWVPTVEGGSLYLRPFMIATDKRISVRTSNEYLYTAIATPVGSYFSGPPRPLSVWINDETSRAVKGGTGAAKCAGNYAGALQAQVDAAKQGCDQVLYLDALEHRWIEELGMMNIFFEFEDGSLLTPPLNGTILPGVTRDSILTLARARGLSVREELYGVDQLLGDAKSGKLKECFVCGTGISVINVGSFKSRDQHVTLVGNDSGASLALSLWKELSAIQKGVSEDRFGWIEVI